MAEDRKVDLGDNQELRKVNPKDFKLVPKANCNDCFGRGWLTANVETGEGLRVCHCVKAIMPKEVKVEK